MINLGRLEGFFRVARAQGYARAARDFPYPITQPGVHQQVKKLEEELGTELFERVGKDRVVLTAAGRLLYGHVAPFLDGLGALEISLREGHYGGTLRILASGLVMRQLFPRWLRRLRTRRPEIDLALSESRADATGLLRSGEADLLVDYLPDAPPDLETRKLATVRAFIALPARHPAARRHKLRLADVGGEAFIAYGVDRRQQRELQMRALAAHGLSPRRVHTADSSENILGFVASGLGFSLVPSLLRAGPRTSGVVARPLDPPSAELPVYAAWRRDSRNPLVDAALEVAPDAGEG
jgi:DNA-binding transcriptional LysR family regulator